MNYILLALAVLILGAQTISFKEFNRRYMINLASYYFFNACYFTVVIVILLASSTGSLHAPHIQTIIWGFAFGAVFIATMLLYMKSMEQGPLSYASLIFSLGLLVPVIFSALAWHERVSLAQAAGLLLLMLTLIMASRPADRVGGQDKKVKASWFFTAVLSMLGNGSLMTLSKLHQMSLPGQDINEFLIIGFGTAAILSGLLFLDSHLRLHEPIGHVKQRPMLFIVLAAGIATAAGNQIVLHLASRMPAVIQFPTLNGGLTMVSTLFAVAVYKERLGQSRTTGLITGLAAIVLLSLH